MGNQFIAAIFILILSLFATIVTMTLIGEVTDRFKYKMDTLDLDYGTARYTHWQDALNNIYKWTYSFPLFFMYVMVFWLFKVAIFEHKYTKGNQNFEF